MRAPADPIHAPPFPRELAWLNVDGPPAGGPLLVEFWDFCRPNSLRTLPYLRAWHARYADAGLRIVSVHAPGFAPSRDHDAVAGAVARLGIEHAVALDHEFALWRAYENPGWPARYLFDARGLLVEYHVGEGGYVETEAAVGELVGDVREPLAPVRPEDDPAAQIVAQSEDREGAYSGPYEAGAVWVVVDGRGEILVDGRRVTVEHPGALCVVEHPHHVAAVIAIEPGPGVTCHATCFTPGLAPAAA